MQNIIKEYVELLKRKSEFSRVLSQFPKGYISEKKIGNKVYYYLQYRENGKIESRYIKPEEFDSTRRLTEARKNAEKYLPEIEKRLNEMEKAARLFGASVSRQLCMLKLCVGMDSIEKEKRESCISFSDAMTSIEGVPVSDALKTDLNSWKDGDVSFFDVYEQTLRRYGIEAEGLQ